MARRRPSISLLQIFVIATAVVLAIGAYAIGSLLVRSLATQALEGVEISVTQYVEGIIGPEVVTRGELLVSPEAERSLQLAVNAHADLISIKLWDRNHTLLWTNVDQSRIGQQYQDNDHLDEVLRTGRATAEWDSLGSPEDSSEAAFDYDRVIETYTPIFDHERRVLGAYEVYSDAARIDEGIASGERDIWILTSAIFASLWVFLVLFGRGTSMSVARRSASLDAKSRQMSAAAAARPTPSAEHVGLDARLREIAHDLSNTTLVIDASIRLAEQGRDVDHHCRVAAGAVDELYRLAAEFSGIADSSDGETKSTSAVSKTSASFANRS